MFGYRIVREEYLIQLETDNQAKAQMLRDYAEVIDGLKRHLDRYVKRESDRAITKMEKKEAANYNIPAQAIPLLGNNTGEI